MAEKLQEWPLAEAKAKFSELIDTAEKNGPQIVTRRGKAAAVIVPFDEYERLKGIKPRRNAIEWLLAPEARIENLPVPDRKTYKWRKPPKF